MLGYVGVGEAATKWQCQGRNFLSHRGNPVSRPRIGRNSAHFQFGMRRFPVANKLPP